MKIVHLSTNDVVGGAAIAASRLHRGLCAAGVESRMLVSKRSGDDPETRAVHGKLANGLRRRLDRLPLALEATPRSLAWRSLGWLPNRRLERAVAAECPDLVHLHWTQNGFLPTSALPRLGAPLVWTFHDLWPVCGSLHHEYDEERRFDRWPRMSVTVWQIMALESARISGLSVPDDVLRRARAHVSRAWDDRRGAFGPHIAVRLFVEALDDAVFGEQARPVETLRHIGC